MKFTDETKDSIKRFIIENISDHPNDILTVTTGNLKISKPTVSKYLNELIVNGIITKKNKGRYPNYQLITETFKKNYDLENSPEEDVIWRKDIMPLFADVPFNIKEACQYGFTEMVNNVIEHSGAKKMGVLVYYNAAVIGMIILDHGIGIFDKIRNDLCLDDPKHSILELAKGKFTSDPNNHTGEGIFFTSRIFDYFAIFSKKLSFFGHKNSDWLFENENTNIDGTCVMMMIKKSSMVSIEQIFNEYADPDKNPGFHKTIIPVKLMQYEGESLLSRSQAKRLTVRFDRFLEVILDFEGVNIIGQAFADEIFRVFQNGHPGVRLHPINCTENVETMIKHVTGKNNLQ